MFMNRRCNAHKVKFAYVTQNNGFMLTGLNNFCRAETVKRDKHREQQSFEIKKPITRQNKTSHHFRQKGQTNFLDTEVSKIKR